RTVGVNQDGEQVVAFERKALMPAGALADRAHPSAASAHFEAPAAFALAAHATTATGAITMGAVPKELALRINLPGWRGRPLGLFEDFNEGEIICHGVGRTVGESEHMQLATLFRNSHPLHFDEIYAQKHGFTGARVVMGGLVFAWVAALAGRDTT